MKVRKDEPDGFESFWSLWLPIKRRNDGRGDARDGFAKLVKAGADPQDIIDGARWYVRNLPTGYEYVPLAKTWLNRGVWEDDCEREREFRRRQEETESRNVVSFKPALPANHFSRRYEQKKAAEG